MPDSGIVAGRSGILTRDAAEQAVNEGRACAAYAGPGSVETVCGRRDEKSDGPAVGEELVNAVIVW
jgi:hypothetical protein